MKNYLILYFLSLVIFSPIIGHAQNKLTDKEEQKIIETVTTILQNSHYKPAILNDSFSKAVFTDFLIALDADKRIFLASDIDEFKKYETTLDDLIKSSDLTFFNLVYDRVVKRMGETKVIYTNLLQKPIDFTVDESINPIDNTLAYTRNQRELKNRWREQLKYLLLENLADSLAKKPFTFDSRFVELEKNTRVAFLKKINSNKENIDILTRAYFFEKYINAIVLQFDPHSRYMILSKNESDINLAGKLVGIGARLVIKEEAIAIGELAYGGPAFNSKQIEVGDVILSVTEKNNIPIDITGFKLPEVVALMKGTIGTQLTLSLKKENGSVKTLTIQRDVIEINDSFAKSCVVEKNGKKFGIIDLPKFYKDFEDTNSRDAAKDVQKEIDHLKQEGINGIIMDLRNNGGGAFDAAIDITGLFIKSGPVVQIKSANRSKEILEDKNESIQWEGPLVVLLNNDSASASEIFAGAIQDYQRGIIMGSKQSYGKGTVQKISDLEAYIPKASAGKFGALKTTIKKFYRINGGSTQLKGIASDIVMPDDYLFSNYGERGFQNAIAWDTIEPLPYTKWPSGSNFEKIIAASNKRIEANKHFQLLRNQAQFKAQNEQNELVNLNIEKYQAAYLKNKDVSNLYLANKNYENDLFFQSTTNELAQIKKTPTLGVKRKEWHNLLATDIYIEEALNVLNDLKNNELP